MGGSGRGFLVTRTIMDHYGLFCVIMDCYGLLDFST